MRGGFLSRKRNLKRLLDASALGGGGGGLVLVVFLGFFLLRLLFFGLFLGGGRGLRRILILEVDVVFLGDSLDRIVGLHRRGGAFPGLVALRFQLVRFHLHGSDRLFGELQVFRFQGFIFFQFRQGGLGLGHRLRGGLVGGGRLLRLFHGELGRILGDRMIVLLLRIGLLGRLSGVAGRVVRVLQFQLFLHFEF